MIGLLRKDFYLIRSKLFLFIGLTLFLTVFETWILIKFADLQIIGIETNTLAPVINFCIFLVIFIVFASCEGLKGILILTDQGKRSKYYLMTTPLGIKGCIASKYYESVIISLCGFIYLKLFELVCSAITGILIDHTMLFAGMIFVSLFLGSLSIPFYVRFGQNGVHVKTAIIQIIALIVLVYGLFGDISAFIGKENLASRIQKLMYSSDNNAILSWITGADYPLLVFIALMPHLILVLFYFSYRISCILYRKGAQANEV